MIRKKYLLTKTNLPLSIAVLYQPSHNRTLLFTFTGEWKTCCNFNGWKHCCENDVYMLLQTVQRVHWNCVCTQFRAAFRNIKAKGLDACIGRFLQYLRRFFIQCTTCVRDEYVQLVFRRHCVHAVVIFYVRLRCFECVSHFCVPHFQRRPMYLWFNLVRSLLFVINLQWNLY